MDCTFCVAKNKCTIMVQLICVFVLVYAKRSFSHDAAHMVLGTGEKQIC